MNPILVTFQPYYTTESSFFGYFGYIYVYVYIYIYISISMAKPS